MQRTLATILAVSTLLAAGGSACAVPEPPAASAGRSREEPPALDPARVKAAVEKVLQASGDQRRRAAAELIELGPGALAEARRARDGAPEGEARSALDHAARWLLAAKLEPILKERAESGLTFDGQYADLKAEGPEAAGSLLALFDDEETPGSIRIAAAHALADLGTKDLLPAIRHLEEDPLLAAPLREEAGTLLAILGDDSQLRKKIQELSHKTEEKDLNPLERYGANIELSNLYYRIRRYPQAIECYDRAIGILEVLRSRAAKEPDLQKRLATELAQTYYNAACSLSLNKDVERAREMIRKAIAIDPVFLKSLDKDGDLKNLREAHGYAEFRKEVERPLEKKSI
jgi:tetratricopeptide (TPR) repeat protein